MKRIFAKTSLPVFLLIHSSACFSGDVDIPINEVSPAANWVFSLGGGIQFPNVDSTISVNNDTDFEAPYDHDIYSTQQQNKGFIAASVSRGWDRTTQWLPRYSLGLAYQYLFKTEIGDTIMQYSTPEFTNYTYQLDVSSHVILAFSKINLVQYGMISPFINIGAGCAINTANNYDESALPGVTPRESPDFASKTNGKFAFNAGVGVDVPFTEQFILSVAYEYMNLGKVTSGHGTNGWSDDSLNLGTFETNEILISLSYLVGK